MSFIACAKAARPARFSMSAHLPSTPRHATGGTIHAIGLRIGRRSIEECCNSGVEDTEIHFGEGAHVHGVRIPIDYTPGSKVSFSGRHCASALMSVACWSSSGGDSNGRGSQDCLLLTVLRPPNPSSMGIEIGRNAQPDCEPQGQTRRAAPADWR